MRCTAQRFLFATTGWLIVAAAFQISGDSKTAAYMVGVCTGGGVMFYVFRLTGEFRSPVQAIADALTRYVVEVGAREKRNVKKVIALREANGRVWIMDRVPLDLNPIHLLQAEDIELPRKDQQ